MDITSQEQLNAALRSQLESYINIAGARVWKLIDDSIKQYYDNYEPSKYNREYQFFKSCIKTQPKWVGNTVTVEVYIDYDSMIYKPKNQEDRRPSGKEVVDWANVGLHGGLDVNDEHRVWDDPIEELDRGEVFADIISVLRFNGVKVSHT